MFLIPTSHLDSLPTVLIHNCCHSAPAGFFQQACPVSGVIESAHLHTLHCSSISQDLSAAAATLSVNCLSQAGNICTWRFSSRSSSCTRLPRLHHPALCRAKVLPAPQRHMQCGFRVTWVWHPLLVLSQLHCGYTWTQVQHASLALSVPIACRRGCLNLYCR